MTRLIEEPVEIAVVDYGMGNRRSVEKALAHVGASVVVTSDVQRLRDVQGLVVPGVGAFPRAIDNLRRLGLDELLVERVRAGTPVLGICLGMQLAFDASVEQGGADGLGLVPGQVRTLAPGSLKLPHIGWNEVTFSGRRSPLVEGLPERCAFYHVHSFAPVPHDRDDVLGSAEYGASFVTAVQRDSFYGVQFHPEKSSAAGLRMLANFANICLAAREPSTAAARSAS
jgi:imidazole glycerol-phosphate synthase subunit HisH